MSCMRLIHDYHIIKFSKNYFLERIISQNQAKPLIQFVSSLFLHRKEVIHPHLPVGIPCYDFTPIAYPTFVGPLLKG